MDFSSNDSYFSLLNLSFVENFNSLVSVTRPENEAVVPEIPPLDVIAPAFQIPDVTVPIVVLVPLIVKSSPVIVPVDVIAPANVDSLSLPVIDNIAAALPSQIVKSLSRLYVIYF